MYRMGAFLGDFDIDRRVAIGRRVFLQTDCVEHVAVYAVFLKPLARLYSGVAQAAKPDPAFNREAGRVGNDGNVCTVSRSECLHQYLRVVHAQRVVKNDVIEIVGIEAGDP